MLDEGTCTVWLICLTAGLLDHMVFHFLRNLHTVSHSGYTNLHSHQQCRSSLFSTLSLAFVIYRLFKMAVLTGVWYSSLICISLIIDDVEHLVVCLLANCMSLKKCLFGSFVHFQLDYLVLLSFMSYFYVLEIKPLVAMFANIFPHFIDCLFVLFMVYFGVQSL